MDHGTRLVSPFLAPPLAESVVSRTHSIDNLRKILFDELVFSSWEAMGIRFQGDQSTAGRCDSSVRWIYFQYIRLRSPSTVPQACIERYRPPAGGHNLGWSGQIYRLDEIRDRLSIMGDATN
jgi:hypothetical protein